MNSNKKDVSSKGVNGEKYKAQTGKAKHSARYNNNTMLEQTIWAKEGFAGRLAALRVERGVSARDMSLSMGMAANYINSIENGENMPSMAMFLEICEFLDVTPKEFFNYSEYRMVQKRELVNLIEGMDADAVELLLKLAKKIRG